MLDRLPQLFLATQYNREYSKSPRAERKTGSLEAESVFHPSERIEQLLHNSQVCVPRGDDWISD